MRFEKKRIAGDFRSLVESLNSEARKLDAELSGRPAPTTEDEAAERRALDAASARVAEAIAKVRSRRSA